MARNKIVEKWLLNIRDFFRSHHVQLALATAVSIIALALVSKRVLATPMDDLAMAFPPFLAVIAEGVITRFKGRPIATTSYWVAAILFATALVIALHVI